MVHDGGGANSPMIGDKRCGSNVPDPITSTGNQLFLRFHSDYSITSTGFEISVEEGG